jgi:hypothetical protein
MRHEEAMALGPSSPAQVWRSPVLEFPTLWPLVLEFPALSFQAPRFRALRFRELRWLALRWKGLGWLRICSRALQQRAPRSVRPLIPPPSWRVRHRQVQA